MIVLLLSVGAILRLGAVFAILLFVILMKVFRMMREDRKFMEDRLSSVLNDYNAAIHQNTEAQKHNAEVNSELYTWLKARNGVKH